MIRLRCRRWLRLVIELGLRIGAGLAGAAMDGCAGFIEQIVEDGGKMVDIEMTGHGGQSGE